MKRAAQVAVLLTGWLTANAVPHLVVFAATGTIYYELAPAWSILIEAAIMGLNLLLPLVAVRLILGRDHGVLPRLGWRWRGWSTLGVGLLGFLVTFGIALTTQQLIGDPLATPGQPLTRPVTVLAALFLLLVLTAAAEEMMFRGWIQTTLTELYGAGVGIGVTALLFGLRHLPMDLYAGLTQHAPPTAWISRRVQLYAGALVFGLVRARAKSTWASWIAHELFLLLIVVLSVVTSAA